MLNLYLMLLHIGNTEYLHTNPPPPTPLPNPRKTALSKWRPEKKKELMNDTHLDKLKLRLSDVTVSSDKVNPAPLRG